MQFEFIYLESNGNSLNPVNAAIIIRFQIAFLRKKNIEEKLLHGIAGKCIKINFGHYNFNNDNKSINS